MHGSAALGLCVEEHVCVLTGTPLPGTVYPDRLQLDICLVTGFLGSWSLWCLLMSAGACPSIAFSSQPVSVLADNNPVNAVA